MSEVWIGKEMGPFFKEVTKAFAEHCGPDEIITAHLPKIHHGEQLHSQINLINKANKNCFKIKFGE